MSIMASALVLLLHLLLVSLASASHHMGGTATVTYKGKNPDGSLKVDFRYRNTFDTCQYGYFWNCISRNCGVQSSIRRSFLDRSTNAPPLETFWCEAETVESRDILNDKPFEMWANSCCWILTRNSVSGWRLLTYVDLGTRSDTKEPNRSPDIAIIPFLRVPYNCPRTYKLVNFDPDGDKVRCRYGNAQSGECGTCDRPVGFILDEDSCTLQYNKGTYNIRVYGFEVVVEDFPQSSITLAYYDGSVSSRVPVRKRRKRQVPDNWATSTPITTSTTIPTTTAPHTTTSTTGTTGTTVIYDPFYVIYGRYSSPTPPTTTTPYTTTEPWHPHHTSTTPPPTTTTPYTTTEPWHPHHTSTTPPPTTTTPYTTTEPWHPHHTSTTPTTSTTTTTIKITTPGTWPQHTSTTPTTSTTITTIEITTPGTGPQQLRKPFSKLPLHFSLLVDDSVPSCTVGDYLPKFLYPTPDNGAHIQAEVNKEVEIRVKAQATYAEIQNVIFSGPQGITKRRISTGEFAIIWTPRPDDLGQHYVICFLVESTSEFRDYHSDMRCVIVDVRHRIVEAHVICSQSEMRVEVDKSTIPRLSEDNLHLIDPSCGLISNDTHIFASIPLHACGTEIEEDDTYLKFKNEIISFDNRGDVITRKHLLEVQFFCQYPKRGKVTQNFLAHRNVTTVMEKGMGKFTYEFELYDDATFQNMLDPNSYPLEFDLGERIYMQIKATSSLKNIELFVESCRAAPYDNPNSKPVYPILENGCTEDSTLVTYPSQPNTFQFSMEAFKFIGLHDQVFISCSVLICRAGEPDTRCTKGCIRPPQPNGSPNGRRKRGVVTQSSLHHISQGPLCAQRRKRSLSPVINTSVNVIFIAGCLVGAVGMIIGATMYFFKISKMKYQPLPTRES